LVIAFLQTFHPFGVFYHEADANHRGDNFSPMAGCLTTYLSTTLWFGFAHHPEFIEGRDG
jgi:hypothetical protein